MDIQKEYKENMDIMDINDNKVQELLKKVEEKEAEIKKAEKPKWETNCSFRFEGNRTANLQVLDEDGLLEVLTYLVQQNDAYNKASNILRINKIYEHSGFNFSQWEKDIKTRISILRLNNTRAQLKMMKEKLEELMSPDLKTKKSLEEIERMLS